MKLRTQFTWFFGATFGVSVLLLFVDVLLAASGVDETFVLGMGLLLLGIFLGSGFALASIFFLAGFAAWKENGYQFSLRWILTLTAVLAVILAGVGSIIRAANRPPLLDRVKDQVTAHFSTGAERAEIEKWLAEKKFYVVETSGADNWLQLLGLQKRPAKCVLQAEYWEGNVQVYVFFHLDDEDKLIKYKFGQFVYAL